MLAESAARLMWVVPWHDALIAEQAENLRFPYRLNSLGLRDRDYDAPKPSAAKRVLVLGDSFSFGVGVRSADSVFPEILERRLNELPHASSGVEVLNGGIPNSLTGEWVDLWQRVSAEFEPDLVLIVFFLRDGTRMASIPEFFGRIRKEIVDRNRQSRLYRLSYVYRMYRDHQDSIAVASEYTLRFQHAYFGDDAETSEWKRAQRNILAIRDMATERSVNVGLVVFPILAQLDEQYPFRAICDLLERFGVASHIPVHNLLPAYLGRDSSALWVSPRDQHPNEAGHAIAAESMFPFVADLLFGTDDQAMSSLSTR